MRRQNHERLAGIPRRHSLENIESARAPAEVEIADNDVEVALGQPRQRLFGGSGDRDGPRVLCQKLRARGVRERMN